MTETTSSPLNNVITIDDERIKNHLDRVVRGSVEETLNGLLEAEADRLCNAQRYERSEARRDTRAGHYERRLQAPGRGHHGSSMGHAGTRDRLQAALPRLQDRLAELGAAEEDARRRAVYDKVKAERDKLAEELARVYPPLVDQLVDLMTRLAASDQALNACNRALPRDAEHLPTAEEIARGLHDYEVQYCKEKGRRLDPQLPRLATELKLPKFEAADGRMFVWPPETKGLPLNELARLAGKEAA